MKSPAIGLVGIGGFGRVHFEALRRFDAEGRVRFQAVCDPAILPGSNLEHELRSSGLRVYREYREMLAVEGEMNAVTLATPIPLHEQMTADCLDRGLFVYLEKPPVPVIDQLDSLVARDPDFRVSVGFHMVDLEWAQWLKARISERKLGEVREMTVTANWPRRAAYYRRSAWAGCMALNGEPVFDGPATNALAHLIHMIMFFAGETARDFAVPTSIRGEFYRVKAIESYDLAGIEGILSTGPTFCALLSHASPTGKPFRLEIKGTRGWCHILETGRIHTSWGESHRVDLTSRQLDRAYESFLNRIAGLSPRPTTSLRDASGYVLATNAALLSSGGIHSIDFPWKEPRRAEGNTQYEVTGLDDALSVNGGGLFSERGLPWSIKTPWVKVASGLEWADAVRDLILRDDGTHSKTAMNSLPNTEANRQVAAS